MAAVDLSLLTPDTRRAWAELVHAADRDLGLTLVPRSGRRSCAEQAEQYAIGRLPGDTRAVVTHAQGCRSWHVLGRAVDFFVYRGSAKSAMSSDYTAVGALAETLGWVWGGRFKGFGPNGDEGHVEWHPGRTIEQMCPDPAACRDDMVVTVDSGSDDDGSEASGPSLTAVIGGGLIIGTVLGLLYKTLTIRT